MASLWGRLPLSFKISLPFFLLTLLVGVGGTYVATRLAWQAANDRLTIGLVEALRAADAELLGLEGRRVDALGKLLDGPELSAAIARRDAARLLDLLDPLPQDADWAAVVAADGVTLAARRAAAPAQPGSGAAAPTAGGAAGAPPASPSGLAVGRSRPVELALQGVADFSGERHGGLGDLSGAPSLVAAAPVHDGTRVVGALVVGSDMAAAAQRLKLATRADAALFDAEGHALVNTLAPGQERAALPAIDAAPADDELRPARMRAGDSEYVALVAPLRVRDATVGALAIALPAEAVESLGAETRQQLTWLFGGAMIAAAMLGFLISGLISRPIHALAVAARAVGAGDLARRSGVRGSDEIGTLGQTFDAMTANLQLRQHQLAEAYLNTVRALANAVDAKDPYTHGHSQRVAAYALRVARQLGLDDALMPQIEMGGLLHDVGKIGVPDHVLLKPGKLDDAEFEMIKRHAAIGHDILRPIGFEPTVMHIVRHHHERMNGRGYPDGLVGESIPLVARIVCVCDAYDTMTSDRAYQRSRGHAGAVDELRKWAGQQFDPACIEALATAVDEPLPSGVAQQAYAGPAAPAA
jgi:putative nucleotidyltransferase with HDIG domain